MVLDLLRDPKLKVKRAQSLVVNAPSLFKDPAFIAWLNNGQTKFTWHEGGEPTEHSDVVVLVNPASDFDGTEAHEMPDHAWEFIFRLCVENFDIYGPGTSPDDQILVRLTNRLES